MPTLFDGADVRSAVQQAVEASARPLTVAATLKAVKVTLPKAKKPAVEAALAELADAGTLHRHPPAKAGGAPLFHHLPAAEFAAERLREALAGEDRLTTRALRKAVGKAYEPFFDEAIASLVAAGRVQPTRFLTARHLTQLTSIIETMNTLRATPLSLTAVLALLDGAPGMSAAQTAPPAPAAPAVAPAAPSAPEAPGLDDSLNESQLIEWYTADLPALGGLRSVPIPWTWKRYEAWCAAQARHPNLERFHRHLLAMASRSVVGLTPHDHEGRLPESEKRVLPMTQSGYHAYYWTVLR